MSENLEKARFWSNYLVVHCECSKAEVIGQHLVGARFSSFCPCGCSSFEVEVANRNDLEPLIPPKPTHSEAHYGFFSHDRILTDGGNLSITAFCDAQGILCGIDVDINTNTEPVPDPVVAARLLGLK